MKFSYLVLSGTMLQAEPDRAHTVLVGGAGITEWVTTEFLGSSRRTASDNMPAASDQCHTEANPTEERTPMMITRASSTP